MRPRHQRGAGAGGSSHAVWAGPCLTCNAFHPSLPSCRAPQTQDLSRRLKDESNGLDLLGYIEFQRCGSAFSLGAPPQTRRRRRPADSTCGLRGCSVGPTHTNTPAALAPAPHASNYRACVRAHKMALSAQRTFWMALLHDTIHFKSLQKTFSVMNAVGARGESGRRLRACLAGRPCLPAAAHPRVSEHAHRPGPAFTPCAPAGGGPGVFGVPEVSDRLALSAPRL
jgi:hypothetical protein